MPIPLRADFDAQTMRAAAQRSKDGPRARRLLELAVIYDGGTRADAARIGGVTRAVNGNVADKPALRKALEQGAIDSPRGSFRHRDNHFPVQNAYLVEAAKQADGTIGLVRRRVLQENVADPYNAQCTMK